MHAGRSMPHCVHVMCIQLYLDLGVIHSMILIWITLWRLLQVGSMENFGFSETELCPFPILDIIHLPSNKVIIRVAKVLDFIIFFFILFSLHINFIHLDKQQNKSVQLLKSSYASIGASGWLSKRLK